MLESVQKLGLSLYELRNKAEDLKRDYGIDILAPIKEAEAAETEEDIFGHLQEYFRQLKLLLLPGTPDHREAKQWETICQRILLQLRTEKIGQIQEPKMLS